MACGSCGGGNRRSSAAGTWTAPGVAAEPQEWVVTFPDGTQKTYDTDTAAYRAVRVSGGGIQQRAKKTTKTR